MRTHLSLCLAGILWLFELVCPAAVSLADATTPGVVDDPGRLV